MYTRYKHRSLKWRILLEMPHSFYVDLENHLRERFSAGSHVYTKHRRVSSSFDSYSILFDVFPNLTRRARLDTWYFAHPIPLTINHENRFVKSVYDQRGAQIEIFNFIFFFFFFFWQLVQRVHHAVFNRSVDLMHGQHHQLL